MNLVDWSVDELKNESVDILHHSVFCEKHNYAHSSRHRCTKGNVTNCSGCNRMLMKPGYCFYKSTADMFCDSNIGEKSTKFCDDCNFTFGTMDCYKSHKKVNNKFTYYCGLMHSIFKSDIFHTNQCLNWSKFQTKCRRQKLCLECYSVRLRDSLIFPDRKCFILIRMF